MSIPPGLIFEFSIRNHLGPPSGAPLSPRAHPTIDERLRKLARILNFSDPVDSHFQDQIAYSLQAMTLPVPPSSPFHGTDLIVCRDSTRLIPLNGIKETDFHALEYLFMRIVNAQTSIEIRGGSEFRALVLEQIKMLMTRRLGRRLLEKIVGFQDNTLAILPVTPTYPDSITRWGRNNREVFIYLDFVDEVRVVVRSPQTGWLTPSSMPHFMTVGHEMIHALNIFSSPNLEAHLAYRELEPLERHYNCREEERTIATFLPRSPQFPLTLEEADAIAWGIDAVNEDQITENSLRSVFGMPARVGHEGTHVCPEIDDINDPDLIEYFFQTCHVSFIGEMHRLIGKGMDVNIYYPQDSTKKSALMCACINGRMESIDLLLRCGADPNRLDANGLTLLHYAIHSADPLFVAELIRRGLVNVTAADQTNAPLIIFTLDTLGKRCMPMIRLLMQHGASIHARAREGRSALHASANLTDLSFFHELVSQGLDPHASNENGVKPIHMALIYGNLPLFQALCRSSQDLYQLTPCGKSLMFFAMWSGNQDTVAYLLELEKNVWSTFFINPPPFHLLYHMDSENNLPISFAFKRAQWDSGQNFVMYLLSLGLPVYTSNPGKFVSLFALSTLPIREIMLDTVYCEQGMIDRNLCFGEPLLRWAIKEGDLSLVLYALNRGAQLNPAVSATCPTTPLHDAVQANKADIVRLLLERGASNTALDANEHSPLQYVFQKIAGQELMDISILHMLYQARVQTVSALRCHINTSFPSDPC